jgi:signal transduction histidine kinase
LLAALALFGVYLTSLYSYLLFHSFVEMFSIVVACGVFMIAWNSRRFLDNNYLLFIGIAYLFIAGLDLIHTLAYTGMGVFQGYGSNLPTQLWISARYTESLSLLIAFLFLGRRLRPNLVFLSYTVATSLLLMSIFYWDIFPQSFAEGVGLTPFKKVSEYIISLILLGSMAMLVKNRRQFDTGVLQLLGVSIAFTIASELAFTFYVQAYGLSNLIGHFFKVISFYLIYRAVIETGLQSPFDFLFRNLKQSEEGLRKAHDELETRVERRTAELAGANEELRTEIAERKRVEGERTLLQRRLEALWGVASMVDADFETLHDRVVAEILAMTQSYYARYGFISEDESVFTLYTWSEQARQDCQVRGRALHRPVAKGGLWADAVRQRKALIINDYQGDNPGKKGLPQGHIALTRVLTVPIFSHGRIVALATVANKPSDYTEEDARQIEAFVTGAQVILERQRAEEQLQATKEQLIQQDRLASIGQLVSGVAHEVNNPLTAVIGFTQLLLRRDLGEDVKSDLGVICQEAQRAATITRNLLSFARQNEPDKSYVSVNEAVESALALRTYEMKLSNIEVVRWLQPDLPRTMADLQQLRQVFLNMVLNAEHAMADAGGGGRLEVSTLQAGVFDPFFTTKEPGKGTGLGLSICYGIFQEHGGSIRADSGRGKGATFTVEMPVLREETGLPAEG